MNYETLINAKKVKITFLDVEVTWRSFVAFADEHNLNLTALANIFNISYNKAHRCYLKGMHTSRHRDKIVPGSMGVILQLLWNDPSRLELLYKVDKHEE